MMWWAFSCVAASATNNAVTNHIASGMLGAGNFSARSWGTPQGLTLNTIDALCQSQSGYSWVGGQSGLASFDGVQFRVYGARDGLPDSAWFIRSNTCVLLALWEYPPQPFSSRFTSGMTSSAARHRVQWLSFSRSWSRSLV